MNCDSQKELKENNDIENKTMLMIDYYQRPLALLGLEYQRSNVKSVFPNPIRSRFWQFVNPRDYEYWEGRNLLEAYLHSIESELKAIISNFSIGYWLHIYRRIFPGSIGIDDAPQTIGLTRAVLEAAIQKYARKNSCSRIGLSNKIDIKEVFNGLLTAPDFALERELLQSSPSQLVLTNFSLKEFIEIYDIEKLSYEIWLSEAILRAIAMRC